MNILDYILNGGSCKSKSGHWFHLDRINSNQEYPISGWLHINDNFYRYNWNENGVPENLPYTHGLDLMPVITITSYKMLTLEELSNYNSIKELVKNYGV